MSPLAIGQTSKCSKARLVHIFKSSQKVQSAKRMSVFLASEELNPTVHRVDAKVPPTTLAFSQGNIS